ncbi:hypothetical protein WS63_21975 [Burkholderia stagnalis]|nr:hypothetical protein WS59_28715 [Burkholderia stagnalis]KVD85673.1 hypothetical protein WS63_21975 [Burkholderia stagnalis]KVN12889.1 hypothetical protein WT10_26880 [Burkholderia stagnalis]KWI69447.1 hypothetical protein WT75_18825 [Burkholderia stagnalis]KWK44642.1 hypothetical protein WT80_22740 [Burkholderia stagnalis]
MLEIEVPSFILENTMEEVQICFALARIRSHAWLIRQREAYSPGQLWIGIEQFSENVTRAFIEPLVVLASLAKEERRRLEFDLINGQISVLPKRMEFVNETVNRAIG